MLVFIVFSHRFWVWEFSVIFLGPRLGLLQNEQFVFWGFWVFCYFLKAQAWTSTNNFGCLGLWVFCGFPMVVGLWGFLLFFLGPGVDLYKHVCFLFLFWCFPKVVLVSGFVGIFQGPRLGPLQNMLFYVFWFLWFSHGFWVLGFPIILRGPRLGPLQKMGVFVVFGFPMLFCVLALACPGLLAIFLGGLVFFGFWFWIFLVLDFVVFWVSHVFFCILALACLGLLAIFLVGLFFLVFGFGIVFFWFWIFGSFGFPKVFCILALGRLGLLAIFLCVFFCFVFWFLVLEFCCFWFWICCWFGFSKAWPFSLVLFFNCFSGDGVFAKPLRFTSHSC